MNQNIKWKTFLFFFILSICKHNAIAYAGGVDPYGNINSQTIMFPHVYKPWEFKKSISILFTRLPLDWVETSIEVPIIQFNGKLGLPAGFTIESSLQSIYVSNQFRIGPHWNIEWGKFSFAAGMDAALLFGKMKIAGFDNKAWGWCNYPNLSVGFNTGEIAFTLSAEYSILQSLKITSGTAEISQSKNFKSGQSISLFMEQRLWKNHVMIIGVINSFQKFYYIAWPAFSTFNRQYYIPQFYLGLVL